MLDYLYSEEGSTLLALGMDKEEFESIQDPTYIKYGLEDGAYTKTVMDDGQIVYDRNPKLIEDNDLASAMALKRLTCGYYVPGIVPALNRSYDISALRNMTTWDYYLNTGYIDKSLRAQFTSDEAALFSKVYSNVDTYMSQNIPKFIMGVLDINGVDWDNYAKMLNKYSPNKVTAIYQRVFDTYR